MSGCIRCGSCCNNFLMTKGQVIRILEYLKEKPNVIKELRETPEVEGIPNVCIFLRGTVGRTYCKIYSVRPEICRVFGVEGRDGLECPKGTITSKYTATEAEEIIDNIYKVSQNSVGHYDNFFRSFIKNVPNDSVAKYNMFFDYYIQLLKD